MRDRFAAAVIVALMLAALSPTAAVAQVHTATAHPDDVASVDGIITALYAVISGPAGPREWHRFQSLFMPGAFLMSAGPRPDSLPPPAPISPEGYRERVGPMFAREPFYEDEAARRTESYGTVVHVWSTYVSRRAPGAEPFQRGINSIQLVRHAGRWWIASIVWDFERPDNPVPDRYLRDPGS